LFIEGREFNLTVLGGAGGPRVLPPAEIDFGAFPDGKPHIVGYRAKWDAGSFEFHHTPRRFDFPQEDGGLLDHLTMLALRAWDEFGLRGYARVDFRVDRAGQPWILEVNANPCLAPDAGLAAAVQHSGIGYDRAIQWIVEDAACSASAASTTTCSR
jgi:D-alanine-D-alanine ligase